MTNNRAVWIWYPGDQEIWLHKKVSMRRDERGVLIPPFWRIDGHEQSVKFRRKVHLDRSERVVLHAEGRHNVVIDGAMVYEIDSFTIPAGEHELVVSVYNPETVPAILLAGETVWTDASWHVSRCDQVWLEAGTWQEGDPTRLPSEFRFARQPLEPVRIVRENGHGSDGSALFADFGRETFGYVTLTGVEGAGIVRVYYGESHEEAMSPDGCETFDDVAFDGSKASYQLPASRAFRYVRAVPDGGLRIGGLAAEYEYLPLTYRGAFRCSNERLNDIWDTAAYTLHLNTREFFLDGIKRDRWVWSGDAYQSFLLNDYLFFDEAVTKRTLVALRGKDPVGTHLNFIMDYSFYWILGVYDNYLYGGDLEFLRAMYPKLRSLLEFCLGRTNANGMMEGLPGDWVFVDWADMEKDGELCFEQLLLCRSLEAAAETASLLGHAADAETYAERARTLKRDIFDAFWDDSRGAFAHSRLNGVRREAITQYPNLFALLFGYLDGAKRESVIHRVLLSPDVPAIKTPYMKFYELAALCEAGEHRQVVERILAYWGGMLDLGATTFWEEYDPTQSGPELYAMYGRPYGKSLCHAWGASPIYLFGRYFLGVRPTSPGYATYLVEPALGGLERIEGVVPTPNGDVEVRMDRRTIRVSGAGGTGKLRFRSAIEPLADGRPLARSLEGWYELELEPHKTYEVLYA